VKIALAIEGGDGTGKTTLAHTLQVVCQQQGFTCQIVGKKAHNASQAIANITNLIQMGKMAVNPNNQLYTETDVYLRIAREYQRAIWAKNCDADIIIFDRFIISTMSWAYLAALRQQEIKQTLLNIADDVRLKATFFCTCPFEIAWQRVMDRAKQGIQALSPKELRGKAYNKILFQHLKQEFDLGQMTGHKLEIDTTTPQEQNEHLAETFITQIIAPQLRNDI
jgi:thymidylate kinase